MPLIRVPQHTPEDLAAWERLEREDAAWAARPRLGEQIEEAVREIDLFVRAGPCYVSTSWGKDSTVVAHLVWVVGQVTGVLPPLAWLRLRGRENPHCPLVRDQFLAAHPWPSYVEVETEERPEDTRRREAMDRGWAEIRRVTGTARRITGLRGDESGGRGRRMAEGLTLGVSCAPIGHWTARDVYAYLWRERLPVHPAYAMSHGGRLDRDHLRVAQLGGRHGTGMGRAEWERRYYRT